MIYASKPLGLSIASRGTRRWMLVAFWCVIAASLCTLGASDGHGSLATQTAFNMLIFLPLLLGGVCAGGLVKPFRGIRFVPLQARGVQTLLHASALSEVQESARLDERESRLRDRVHFIAYTVSRWLALVLTGVCALLGTYSTVPLSRVGPLLFYLLTLTLWSLPQTLILWSEPDMEE